VQGGGISHPHLFASEHSYLYLLLNLFGSALLAVLVFISRQWGLLLLEEAWALCPLPRPLDTASTPSVPHSVNPMEPVCQGDEVMTLSLTPTENTGTMGVKPRLLEQRGRHGRNEASVPRAVALLVFSRKTTQRPEKCLVVLSQLISLDCSPRSSCRKPHWEGIALHVLIREYHVADGNGPTQ
jgi:hypothetical protein